MVDFSERFSPAIRGVVEFYKRVPGCSQLNQDDQVTLLKAGVFEVLLVRFASYFDSRANTMMTIKGQLVRRDQVGASPNDRFLIDSMFSFAERMNKLNLTMAEIGLFSAVVLVTPGNYYTNHHEGSSHQIFRSGVELIKLFKFQ